MGLGSAVGMSALVVAGMAIYFATDPIRFTRNMTTHTAGVVVISGSSSGIGLDLGMASLPVRAPGVRLVPAMATDRGLVPAHS